RTPPPPEGKANPWAAGRRSALAPIGRSGRDVGARARQREGVQRRRDQSKQRGVDEIGAVPSHRLEQNMGRGPAHRRGEAAGKRERRDRSPRGGAEDTTERGKGRIVKGRSGGDAEQQPDREISGGRVGGE